MHVYIHTMHVYEPCMYMIWRDLRVSDLNQLFLYHCAMRTYISSDSLRAWLCGIGKTYMCAWLCGIEIVNQGKAPPNHPKS